MNKTQHKKNVLIETVLCLEDYPPESIFPYLTQKEQALYKTKPKHKQPSWLLGRMAAKQSVQKYFSYTYPELKLSQIEVLNDANGIPLVNLHLKTPTSDYPLISISHSETVSVSSVISPTHCTGFGIDIEKIRKFNPETVSAFMVKNEYSLFEETAPDKQPSLATLIWSIKESFLKAKGTGIRIHPNKVKISLAEDSLATKTVVFANEKIPCTVTWTTFQDSYIIVNTILL